MHPSFFIRFRRHLAGQISILRVLANPLVCKLAEMGLTRLLVDPLEL